jgi:16S rRNA (cytidine1402-2'-O)-methyltransferase
MQPLTPGLYLVATPLGNLGDMTLRARDVLAGVDCIACEDTRTSLHLLRHLGIEKPLVSYHDHNETARADELAAKIQRGARIALISDAGTPGISDPGFRIVRACHRLGLPVTPLPGPCALTAALSASGLPTHAFFFGGFLPPKTAARRRFLESVRDAEHTSILYESCHRVEAFAAEIVEVLGGGRVVCIAKELTKLHERILSGPASEVLQKLNLVRVKGEFVVLIAPVDYQL